MSWWKKILGAKDATGEAPAKPTGAAPGTPTATKPVAVPAPAAAVADGPVTFPLRVEIIPGALSGHVYVHEITTGSGRIACWSYVSDGLHAHGQKEVAFTLRRKRDEADHEAPEDPLRLFGTLYRLAAQGQRVTEGGISELGAKRFFDHHLLYVDAQPLAGVPLPPGCLTALLINDDELRAVRQFGCTRLLGRMGQAVTHYPFPPWNERGRRGLSLSATFERSLLSKIGIRLNGPILATLSDNRITVRIARAVHAAWREPLAKLPDAPFVLLALRDPTANACLVWVPGQREPTAISPAGSDGSRVAGACVIVLGDQPASGGKLFEDGFAVELTTAAWTDLRRALAHGVDLAIASTNGGMDFALEWKATIYADPAERAAN